MVNSINLIPNRKNYLNLSQGSKTWYSIDNKSLKARVSTIVNKLKVIHHNKKDINIINNNLTMEIIDRQFRIKNRFAFKTI